MVVTNTDDDYRNYLCLLVLVAYIPLLFLGYGPEYNTYSVLDTAHDLLFRGMYHPSRNPGFFLYESLAGLLSVVGGPAATNAFSLVAAGGATWALLDICFHYHLKNAWLLGLCLLVNPYVVIAATTTMDYMPAIACCLLAASMLLRGNIRWAGVFAGLAIGFRISSVLIIAPGGFCWAVRGNRRRAAVEAAAICGTVGLLLYLPPFLSEGLQMFRAAHVPAIANSGRMKVSMVVQLGEFVYKNIYMNGLFATSFICLMLLIQRFWVNLPFQAMVCCLAIAAEELLFLDLPAKPFYLLPCLPLGLLVMGFSGLNRKSILVPLTVLVALYGVMNVALARPNIPDRATSAKLGVYPEWGVLVSQIQSRMRYVSCSDRTCWGAARSTALIQPPALP